MFVTAMRKVANARKRGCCLMYLIIWSWHSEPDCGRVWNGRLENDLKVGCSGDVDSKDYGHVVSERNKDSVGTD